MKLIIALVATLIATSVQSAEPVDYDKQIDIANEIVSRNLLDPESARFKIIEVVHRGHSYAVCGEINAKNVYGGYVGWRLYYVDFDATTNKPTSHLTLKARPTPYDRYDKVEEYRAAVNEIVAACKDGNRVHFRAK